MRLKEREYNGPYKIIDTKHNGNVIKIDKGNKVTWINIKGIKPFKEGE